MRRRCPNSLAEWLAFDQFSCKFESIGGNVYPHRDFPVLEDGGPCSTFSYFEEKADNRPQ